MGCFGAYAGCCEGMIGGNDDAIGGDERRDLLDRGDGAAMWEVCEARMEVGVGWKSEGVVFWTNAITT